jgi:hypothetical protein
VRRKKRRKSAAVPSAAATMNAVPYPSLVERLPMYRADHASQRFVIPM